MRHSLTLLFGFLMFVFSLIAAVNGAEDRKLTSNISLSYDIVKERLKPGFYLVIGSFRKISRAVKLTTTYVKYDPKVVLSNVKSKKFFRVVVGPIVKKQLKFMRAELGREGVADVWMVNIKAGESSINLSSLVGRGKKGNYNLTKGSMLGLKVKKKSLKNSKSFRKDLKKSKKLDYIVKRKFQTEKKKEQNEPDKGIANPLQNKVKRKITALLQRDVSKTPSSIVSVEKLGSLPQFKKKKVYLSKYSKSFNANAKHSLNVSSDVARSRTINTFGTPGTIFSDCKVCPQQVVIPQGRFMMGERGGGAVGDAPTKEVALTRSFSIGRFEVTVAEWAACANAGGCSSYMPENVDWGLPTRPVTNVSWHDAGDYILWLSGKTGHRYRLPSEAEWEYAARAGSTSKFWWGDNAGINQAACQDCGSLYDGLIVAPVGSFSANAFGLYDTAGNLWEWTQDCYSPESYKKHKTYPESVPEKNDCSRVLRGGAWDVMTSAMHSSFRYASGSFNRSNVFGFRVARDLN